MSNDWYEQWEGISLLTTPIFSGFGACPMVILKNNIVISGKRQTNTIILEQNKKDTINYN